MTASKPKSPLAVIGLGAVLPDAPDATAFWQNAVTGRDSIREVPPGRWRLEDHYDPDPRAPDKTYTKIGAFVTDFRFDPLTHRIPPRVAESMDETQKWAVEAARQALADAGYDRKDFDRTRCAVILGNALAGTRHYLTAVRVHAPRFERALRESPAFAALPAEAQQALLAQYRRAATAGLPAITEDSMPGELSNVIAGRVAQVFGLRGPNFTTDAACASSLAALQAAAAGLEEGRYDLVLTGGVDSSLGPESFVKFSKVGALSPDGSRPFDARANGFVMGEGCAVLLLKRLADAERDGDRVYALVKGLGSSSDGKGKGITAPNPEGQRLALQRAYAEAGISPAEVGLVEAHGTSTTVGDAVEAKVLSELFEAAGTRPRAVALGSIKSQIGHLKSAAGAASLLKAVLALHHRRLPPSLHCERPNPSIDFERGPFFVPAEARDWPAEAGRPRVAAVSSFGFGGTNFHVLLAEHAPAARGLRGAGGEGEIAGASRPAAPAGSGPRLVCVGADSREDLRAGLEAALRGGSEEPGEVPASIRQRAERLVFSYATPEERARKGQLALRALEADEPAAWRALAAQGVARGQGEPGKLAFLFPGQGSQYVGMLGELRVREPVVAETFAEADRVMRPLLGRPLSAFVFTDDTPAARAALQDTQVCQPAMLTADIALLRLLGERGLRPDLVAGHSLGEYAALVAADVLSFQDALLAVSARAKEMAGVEVPDPGRMAAVFASAERIMALLADLPEVVPANFNSRSQTVIAGTTPAMQAALVRLEAEGLKAVPLPVSHAFHSYIVAPAAEPLRRVLSRLDFRPPRVPVVANLDAETYGARPEDREDNLRRLARQVASPVRWAQSLERMFALGARVFVEVGPRKVLASFVEDALPAGQALAVSTNQPKLGDLASLAQALAALGAAGLPRVERPSEVHSITVVASESTPAPEPEIVISGVSLGLPGADRELFADDNTEALLGGYAGIGPLPEAQRQALAGQRIVRLLKDAPGGPAFEVVDSPERVAQLAGQRGRFDLEAEFDLPPERVAALDVTTQMALAAGLLALRDAVIPLVPHHRVTRQGGRLPAGHRLPERLADETGVIFASAFPGYDQLLQGVEQRARVERLDARIAELRQLADELGPLHAVTRRLRALEAERGDGFHLERDFIFRALSMGHAQLAELIGARGPNLQLNAACASTTLAVGLAEDWIRRGRCRRVLVVAADDITNPRLAPWLVGGLLATGAVTTEGALERAALPFDRRRNGMIPGMGAAGLVIESEAVAAERGVRGAVRLLGTLAANSAFHGTRLDPEHISGLMTRLVSEVERRHGLARARLAEELVFVSHETYTPARGGSASAEARALREAFGPAAERVLIANTKGFTGHPMAVGLEDAAAVRMLERQVVPPVANHREVDPDLGPLRLSAGGPAPVRYALRLAAGFGSQVAMTLTERLEPVPGRLVDPARHQAWLDEATGAPGARLVLQGRKLVAEGVKAGNVGELALQGMAVEKDGQDRKDSEDSKDREDRKLDADAVREKILEIAAAKTGYPVDMLDPALDLEADLGIDTVKQAEMFSEIRAAFGIPKLEGMKLSEVPTLGHLVEFALQRMAGEKDGKDPEDSQDNQDSLVVARSTEEEEPGRAPGAMRFLVPELVGLPALEDCLPTGVRLAGARVLLAGGAEPLVDALGALLAERGAEPVRLRAREPEDAAREAAQAGALTGALVLPPEGAAVPLDEPDDERFQAALDARVRLPFRLAQALEAQLGDSAGAFFLVATRLGGLHGFGPEGPADPLAGARTGFAKALQREWGRCLVKAVDLPVEARPEADAQALVGELERGPGAVEIGAGPAGRYGLRCRPLDLARSAGRGAPFESGQVALILGGTGGIAPWLAADLAPQGGSTFWLAGRGPLPAEDDPDVRLLERDRDHLKQVLAERLRAQGGRLTPAAVEAELARIERARAAREAVARVQARGHKVRHARVDATDQDALRILVQDILRQEGRLDLVVLAAGLDHSQALGRKTPEAFDRILGVKVAGLRALLGALRGKTAPRLVLLGSIAGRFGNLGQVDYAAANDVLAKAARARGALTLAYGPWAEVGMASRGSVPQAMNQAGIACLAPAEAQASLRMALEAGLTGEVVVTAGLGALAASEELQCADLEALGQRLAREPQRFPMLGEVLGWSPAEGLELEVLFDARRDPYLDDHRIHGVPVVPGVMAVECFAEAVRLLDPGDGALSVEDLVFEAPLKLYRDAPRRARLQVQPGFSDQGRVYEVRLVSERALVGGRSEEICHHRARLRLTPGAEHARVELPDGGGPDTLAGERIYRAYFHGPSFQVLERAEAVAGGAALGFLSPGREQPRLDRPAELASAPMLAELAFQTAGLLEARSSSQLGLPAAAARLRFGSFAGAVQEPIAALVEQAGGGYSARVVDAVGRVLVEIEGYRTALLPEPLPIELGQAWGPGEPAGKNR
jgi:malonyl CoA-acyl carrier protein transacylase